MSKHQGLNSDFFAAIEILRKKLLDLSGNNNSISFRHRKSSRSQIRIVDEVPNQIFVRLTNEDEFIIKGVPVPDLEPEDEKSSEFQSILEKKKKTDEKYLSDLSELGTPSNKRKLQVIEFQLRDQIRAELNLPPLDRKKRPSAASVAESFGINPNFDLQLDSDLEQHNDNLIQTLIYQDELEAVLDGIVEQKELVESETGTEPLYIALGFLEWYEAEQSTTSYTSPLMFLPAEIQKRKNVKTSETEYFLKLRETEVFSNFSLR
ncbi:MAG: DUF4011 domain-containing protein, partial [Pseudobdellovibrio sp.]